MYLPVSFKNNALRFFTCSTKKHVFLKVFFAASNIASSDPEAAIFFLNLRNALSSAIELQSELKLTIGLSFFSVSGFVIEVVLEVCIGSGAG